MSWIDICHIDDIPLLGARVVKSPIGCIALIRTDEAELYAALDQCPHKGGPISEGIIHGQNVTCPLHNWVFDLNTGVAKGADSGQLTMFDVQVKGERVLLDSTNLGKRSAA